jgi:hypothetical protein
MAIPTVAVGNTNLIPAIATNLTTASATQTLAANQGVVLNAADVASAAVVGTNFVITLKGGTTISADVTALLADVKLTSLVYNSTTKALDGTMSDGATFSVPVADLYQQAATTISPAATNAVGAVGTGTSFARNDHKHPAQAISVDALQHLEVGVDGLHYFSLAATKIGVPTTGNYVLGYANGVLTAFPV